MTDSPSLFGAIGGMQVILEYFNKWHVIRIDIKPQNILALAVMLNSSQCLYDPSRLTYTYQALTLGLWVQWPGGPVDLKTYWPPKKLTGPGGQ